MDTYSTDRDTLRDCIGAGIYAARDMLSEPDAEALLAVASTAGCVAVGDFMCEDGTRCPFSLALDWIARDGAVTFAKAFDAAMNEALGLSVSARSTYKVVAR